MLKKDRLERTIAKMKEKDIPQMLVSDQYALYYLLDSPDSRHSLPDSFP